MSLLQRGTVSLPLSYKRKLEQANDALKCLQLTATHSIQRNEMYDSLSADALVLHDLMNSTAEHMNDVHEIGFNLLPRPDTRVAVSDILKDGRVCTYNLLAVTHALSSALHQLVDAAYTTKAFNDDVAQSYQDSSLEVINPYTLSEHLVELQAQFGQRMPEEPDDEPPAESVSAMHQVATSTAVQSTNLTVARHSARRVR